MFRHLAQPDDFGVSREALFAAIDRLEHALAHEPQKVRTCIDDLERLWELAGLELVRVRRVSARPPTEESLAERLERYGEGGLTLEEQLDEEGIGWGLSADCGYNPGDPPYEVPCPSCGGSGRWGDDIPCGWCEGREVAP